jgi:hypothetical protein
MDRLEVPIPARELVASLWQCSSCGSFISIHSPAKVSQAECPLCAMVPLRFCGSFEAILDLHFDEDSKNFC